MKNDKKIKSLPYQYYYLSIVTFSILGLIASIYLAVSHYRVYTDVGYQSFCAISKSLNCDTVSQSSYSIFLGIPVPIWGIIAYAFFIVHLFLLNGKRSNGAVGWTLLFIFALGFSLYSVILAIISTFYIQSYCIVCISTYLVNFILAFFTFIVIRRFEKRKFMVLLKNDFLFYLKKWKHIFLLYTGFSLLIISIVIALPSYWNFEGIELKNDLPKGTTVNGHHWIGAVKPELTITEFTDYQCFQCRKMHVFLRHLISKNPDKIRLVHKHFPLDHAFNPIVKTPYHRGAGKLSLIAIAAGREGAFWEMNDYLFKIAGKVATINLEHLSNSIKIKQEVLLKGINDSTVKRKLLSDIKDGLKLGITGTPGFVINDSVYIGMIPADILSEYVD